jgi:hypothetical protein
MLRHYRPATDPVAEEIGPDDFMLKETGLDECLDVCAVCRSPSPLTSSDG